MVCRRNVVGALVLTIALSVAACGGSPGAGSSDAGSKAAGGSPVDAFVKDGLRVGFVGEIPWSFVENDGTGTFTGAEAEIVKKCAEGMHIKDVQPVAVQFDGLLPGLQSDRWDVVAAGMSLRAERLQVAIATQQMYGFGVKVLVPKGNPKHIASWSDIAKEKLTVGMVSGGNYQDAAEKLGVKVRPYDSLEAQIADLRAGRLDVVSNAELSLVDYIKKNPDAGVEFADPWNYEGIGASMPALYFKKSNTALRDAFNVCITTMKGNGSLAAILQKWGFDPSTIPSAGPGQPTS